MLKILKLMLGRYSEDEIWSRFLFELVRWPKQVTFASWTQPSNLLCLWQCLFIVFLFFCFYILKIISLSESPLNPLFLNFLFFRLFFIISFYFFFGFYLLKILSLREFPRNPQNFQNEGNPDFIESKTINGENVIRGAMA